MSNITHCPYCKLPLQDTGYCKESFTHDFSSRGTTEYSWSLLDLKKGIQIGKSISHPYYIMFIDNYEVKSIHLLSYVSPENCIETINKFLKLKTFL